MTKMSKVTVIKCHWYFVIDEDMTNGVSMTKVQWQMAHIAHSYDNAFRPSISLNVEEHQGS